MESRLIVVVVFVCAVYQLTEAQLIPVSALSTSITNTTCRTSKLCVSSVTYCDPAGNSSCYFSSAQVSNGVLTVEISGTTSGYVALGASNNQNELLNLGSNVLVFVCGNNNTNAFFETAFQQGPTLYPDYLV
ncbi:putative ferric-chelate reductase 1 [Clarias gariepinus]|uniref:putative ferric-chelate reductase 1 n=1 Tax=Clarias gariepinus TaxID=13013 RepID=UPI00234C0F61|nr:putative ferric-chelate reductase 1 [Clarias gariepinus]